VLAVGALKVVQPPPQAVLAELAAEPGRQLQPELPELEMAGVAPRASRPQAAQLLAAPVLESEQRRMPEAPEALASGSEAES
jgi:hypothetical protein